ncbi:hypothetical protein Hanom_Chr11g01016481 [Helianthus anomalus]
MAPAVLGGVEARWKWYHGGSGDGGSDYNGGKTTVVIRAEANCPSVLTSKQMNLC